MVKQQLFVGSCRHHKDKMAMSIMRSINPVRYGVRCAVRSMAAKAPAPFVYQKLFDLDAVPAPVEYRKLTGDYVKKIQVF